ncbi:hypothetical protein RI367_006553 [Sorochytrium milnesiophthora]
MTAASQADAQVLQEPRKYLVDHLSQHKSRPVDAASALKQYVAERPDLSRSIPSVNDTAYNELAALDGRLVSFTGMVQDSSLSPELYLPFAQGQGDRRICTVFSDSEFEPSQEVLLPVFDVSSVLAKLYDTGNTPGIGEHIALYGILEMHASADSDTPEHTHDNDEMEASAACIPLAVPRLHVLWHQPATLFPSSGHAQPQPDYASVRERLLAYLTAVLGGDSACANYLLLHLISRIHTRTMNIALGSLPLALVNCPPALSARLTNALQMILPAVAYVPLSIAQLNSRSFAPRAAATLPASECPDGDIGVLAGTLQLVSGTQVVVDELALTEGKLNELAITNLQTLKAAVDAQRLQYHFPYNTVGVPIDVNVLFLADGRLLSPIETVVTCMLSSDARVKIDAEQSSWHGSLTFADSQAFQEYITACRHLTCELDAAASKMVEESFVRDRQDAHQRGAPLPGQDELSSRITLARLYGQSFGQQVLQESAWRAVADLDARRRAQLQQWTNAKKLAGELSSVQI